MKYVFISYNLYDDEEIHYHFRTGICEVMYSICLLECLKFPFYKNTYHIWRLVKDVFVSYKISAVAVLGMWSLN